MILGIDLIIGELNKGQRVIFRQPTETYDVRSSDPPQLIEIITKAQRDYFNGYGKDALARLLRPKQGLCDKILEITIDDVLYQSFPCILDATVSNISFVSISVASVRESAFERLRLNANDSIKRQRSTAGEHDNITNSAVFIKEFIIARVVEVFTKGLLYEESSCHYVTSQVSRMIKIHDEIVTLPPFGATSNSSAPPKVLPFGYSGGSSDTGDSNISNKAANHRVPAMNYSNTFSTFNTALITPGVASLALRQIVPADAIDATINPTTPTKETIEPMSTLASPPGFTSLMAARSFDSFKSLEDDFNPTTTSRSDRVASSVASSPSISSVGTGAGTSGSVPVSPIPASSSRVSSPGTTSMTKTISNDGLAPTQYLHSSPLVTALSEGSSGVLDGGIMTSGVSSIAVATHVITGNSSITTNANNNNNNNAMSEEVEFARVNAAATDAMLRECSLARELRSLALALAEGQCVDMLINGFVPIHMPLVAEGFEDVVLDEDCEVGEFTNTGRSSRLRLRPYQTLLLLNDLDSTVSLISTGFTSTTRVTMADLKTQMGINDMKRGDNNNMFDPLQIYDVPAYYRPLATTLFDAECTDNWIKKTFTANTPLQPIHSVILKFLELCQPTSSFEEISAGMSLPLVEVYELAKRIKRWGLGRIINTVTGSVRYRVRSTLLGAGGSSNSSSSSSDAYAFDDDDHGLFSDAERQFDAQFRHLLSYETPAKMQERAGEITSSFPSLLLQCLSVFSKNMHLSDCIEKLPLVLQPHALDIVTWCLKRELLQDVRVYLAWENASVAMTLEKQEEQSGYEMTQSFSSTLPTKGASIVGKYLINGEESRITESDKSNVQSSLVDVMEMCWLEGISEEELMHSVSLISPKIISIHSCP